MTDLTNGAPFNQLRVRSPVSRRCPRGHCTPTSRLWRVALLTGPMNCRLVAGTFVGSIPILGDQEESHRQPTKRQSILPLPVRAIDEAIPFVQKHTLYGARVGVVRRKELWNLPPVAVRAAVIDALAHADYAQRGALNSEFDLRRFQARNGRRVFRNQCARFNKTVTPPVAHA